MVYFTFKSFNGQILVESKMPVVTTAGPGISSSSVTNFQPSDISGTVVSGGTTYRIYALLSTSTTYTINYNATNSTQAFVLAVGGGGAGSNWTGGGGGGGGVVMMPVTIPAGQSTITVNVGAGGTGPISNNTLGNSGTNTTLLFNATGYSINAWGGGRGAGGSTTVPALSGGSGGGGSIYVRATGIAASENSNNFNYANPGSNSAASPNSASDGIAGGGGGAGTPSFGKDGGKGIRCYLPGIKDFTPSGTAYGIYHWGGGGGGCCAGTGGIGGNGGMGGGGGGNYASTTYAAGLGDSNGINAGTAGTNGNGSAGNGGANTGGGGGGAWSPSTGTGGAGGSGIVIIALPQTVVSASTASIFTNTNLTSNALQTVKCAYGCRLLNSNYYGPIMALRYSTDTTGINTANFTTDVSGTLYTGTGISLATWLSSAGANTTYAYVCKWYNQGTDASFNSAYQYTLGSQPIYDVANKVVNYGYTGAGGGVAAPQTNCYFNLPVGAIPYGDSSYTIIFKHWNIPTTGNFGFINGGLNNSTSNCLCIRTNSTNYFEYWGSKNFAITGPIASNNILSSTYVTGSSQQPFYINSILKNTGTMASPRTQVNTSNFIGVTNTSTVSPGTEYINGQMYYMYIFSSALSNEDRAIMEAT